MPSIQDVADQINVKLDQINQSTAATVAVGNGIRSDLTQVNTNIQSGVAELSTGLFAIWELQKVTNSILDHHSDQNTTVICLLENTNDLLCGMTRKLTHQIDLSEQILKSLKRLEGITERVEPGAAGDFDRLTELNDRISECCPPELPEPESCPESCPVSDQKPYRPKGQDWKPSPQPKPPS
jgi:hypothetical protein